MTAIGSTVVHLSGSLKNVRKARRSVVLRAVGAGVAGVMSLSLAGCMVGPNYKPPEMPMPAAYSGSKGETTTQPTTTRPSTQASSQPAAVPSTTQPAEVVDLSKWWTTFNDPELELLVKRAIESNLDIRQATDRILEARAQVGITSADFYPTVNTTGQYTRQQSTISNFGGGSTSGFHRISSLWRAGFDSSWEIDVFGGVRRSIEAANANLQASEEDRRAVQISVAAEVAQTYIQYRGLQREIAITRENLKSQQDTLGLTKSRFNAGLNSELDVAQADAQVESTASQLPSLEQSMAMNLHLLGVLLGTEPNALAEELAQTQPTPVSHDVVPVGLPSDLLRQRPDIRKAERQLAAQNAQIGVATADLFPRFSLTGSLGQTSATFARLADGNSTFWSIGPSVSWPLFDAGRIRANIRLQNASTQAAIALYQSTVLTSLQEVEDALVGYTKEQTRRDILSRAVEANKRATDLSTQLYSRGLADFLTVLDAERQLYASQDQLVQSETLVSTNLVVLYKSLGGGWEMK